MRPPTDYSDFFAPSPPHAGLHANRSPAPLPLTSALFEESAGAQEKDISLASDSESNTTARGSRRASESSSSSTAYSGSEHNSYESLSEPDSPVAGSVSTPQPSSNSSEVATDAQGSGPGTLRLPFMLSESATLPTTTTLGMSPNSSRPTSMPVPVDQSPGTTESSVPPDWAAFLISLQQEKLETSQKLDTLIDNFAIISGQNEDLKSAVGVLTVTVLETTVKLDAVTVQLVDVQAELGSVKTKLSTEREEHITERAAAAEAIAALEKKNLLIVSSIRSIEAWGMLKVIFTRTFRVNGFN